MEDMKTDVSELSNLELVNSLERQIAEIQFCDPRRYKHIKVDIQNLKREMVRRMEEVESEI